MADDMTAGGVALRGVTRRFGHGATAVVALDALSVEFLAGLNVAAGAVTYEPIARGQGREFMPPADALTAVAGT